MSYPRADPRRAAPARTRAYALAGVGAVVADVLFDPVHRHVPLCPLHATTGLWCPLCGSLRAVDELVHGRVVAALHVNALLVAAVVVLGAGYAARPHGMGRLLHRRAVWVAAAVLALAFGVLRNLPAGRALRT